MRRYEPPHPRCTVCSDRYCQASWIYVAHDQTLDLVKIGKSVNINRRFTQYRRETRRSIWPIARWQLTCDFLITNLEEAAQRLLPEERRVQGDWYRVKPNIAVKAVETVRGWM